MLIRLGRNGDQHIHSGVVMPGNAAGKLQHPDAGAGNGVAAFRCAVGDGNAVTKDGGGLLLPGQHARVVVGSGPACILQFLAGLVQGILPVGCSAAQADIIGC